MRKWKQTMKRTEEPARRPMAARFALFNCHINDAQAEACKAYRARYGPRSFDKTIQPLLDDGIMSLFNWGPAEDLEKS